MALFLIKPLDRRLLPDQNDRNRSVFNRRGLADNQHVAVENRGLDHAVAADPQGEQLLRVHPLAPERDIPLDALEGENRLSGGDGAKKRHAHAPPVAVPDQADDAVLIVAGGDIPLRLKLF